MRRVLAALIARVAGLSGAARPEVARARTLLLDILHLAARPAGPAGPWLMLAVGALALVWAGRCAASVLLPDADEGTRWLTALVAALVLQNASVLLLSAWRAVAPWPLLGLALALAAALTPLGLRRGAVRRPLPARDPGAPLAGVRTARRETWVRWVPAALAAAATLTWYVLVVILGVKLPEVGWDALAQHGAVAAAWLQHGGVYVVRTDDYWLNVYPMNTEVALLWQIAILHRDNLLSLVQVPYALLGGIAAFVLARGWGAARPGAVLAGLCFLLVPNTIVQARTAYVDVAFCALFLTTLALWDQARARGSWRHWLLFGTALGLLAGTKPTGLLYGGVLGIAALLWPQVARGQAAGRRWRHRWFAAWARRANRPQGAAGTDSRAPGAVEAVGGAGQTMRALPPSPLAAGPRGAGVQADAAYGAGAATAAGPVRPHTAPARGAVEELAASREPFRTPRQGAPFGGAPVALAAAGTVSDEPSTAGAAPAPVSWWLRLALAFVPAVAFGLWWYVRTFLAYGNPVYPFPLAVGGHVLVTGPMTLGQLLQSAVPAAYQGRPDWYMLSLAWLGRRVSGWYVSQQGWLGVAWPFVELPALLLWAAWGARRAGAWAVLSAAALIFRLQPHNWDPRYTLWLPALGAAALAALPLTGRPRWVAHAALALLAVGGTVAAAPRLLFAVPPAVAVPADRRQPGALFDPQAYAWTATALHAGDRIGYARGPTLLLPLYGPSFSRPVVCVSAPTRSAWLRNLRVDHITVFVTQGSASYQNPYILWMRGVAATPIHLGPSIYAWRLAPPGPAHAPGSAVA